MALSIILLSAANMDFTSLLSGFQELGLKVNIDNPEGSMEVIQYLFRKTGTLEEVRKETAERQKDWKKRQEDAKEKEKETGENVQRRVIDAFPGILIFFGRVLNLLRGLCVSLESRQAYMEVMVV